MQDTNMADHFRITEDAKFSMGIQVNIYGQVRKYAEQLCNWKIMVSNEALEST
jgi:hypothetical protein